ncbi:Lipase, class 3 [Corchorus olitorius]|uniref:Phospholipase A1 n=1 Tax=Corchorus olitorius TaxID=93759 RepID=A0A1R3H4P4_9ROSI|nr:Lipase, class 3 [Corchorus olitorius]
MANSIGSRWRELSGDKNWNGLLHPLDADLRRYIIHYGERTGAVGDLFKGENCMSPKEEFFSAACLEKGNIFKYEVTHYLYAGSNIVEPAWFGYVAVTTDEGKAVLGRRDILIVWRGTSSASEWLNNALIIPICATDLFGKGTKAKVHPGFLTLYTGSRANSVYNKTSAREQVLVAVRELLTQYKDEEVSITVTGFSLGAALAVLNAMDIVAHKYNSPTGYPHKSCMVTAFTFGGPRVGNSGLRKLYEKLAGHHFHLLRIRNSHDPVPKVPYLLGYYVHLGTELTIDSSKSTYLKWRFWFGRSNIITVNGDQLSADSTGIIIAEDEGESDSDNSHSLTRLEKEERAMRGFFEADEWVSAHNMDVYLHSVAGVQANNGFNLEPHYHDMALVNKHLDRLKDEHGIPTNWWEDENRKNMVQMEDGSWVKK